MKRNGGYKNYTICSKPFIKSYTKRHTGESPQEKSMHEFQKYSAALYKQEAKFLIDNNKSRNSSLTTIYNKPFLTKQQDLLSNYERELLYTYTSVIKSKDISKIGVNKSLRKNIRNVHRGRPITAANKVNSASFRISYLHKPSEIKHYGVKKSEFPLKISKMIFMLKEHRNTYSSFQMHNKRAKITMRNNTLVFKTDNKYTLS